MAVPTIRGPDRGPDLETLRERGRGVFTAGQEHQAPGAWLLRVQFIAQSQLLASADQTLRPDSPGQTAECDALSGGLLWRPPPVREVTTLDCKPLNKHLRLSCGLKTKEFRIPIRSLCRHFQVPAAAPLYLPHRAGQNEASEMTSGPSAATPRATQLCLGLGALVFEIPCHRASPVGCGVQPY